ncbi:MAG: hypothetical protein KJ792_03630 [Actinobacteria bacterium]|nr:hypothetical protein [Actinomycetota bacterium]MCG2803414.1 hypothetical protein [Cellulomonas sp.]
MIVRLGTLIVRDLAYGYRAWIALLVSVCGMATVFALSLALLLVGAAAQGEAQDAYVAIAGVALAFSVLTGVANLVQVARVSISLRRRAVALWHLAGVLPGQAFAMTLTQVTVVCLGGGLAATLLAPVLWVPLSDFVRTTGLPQTPGLSQSIPPGATLWAVVVAVGVGALGGVPGALTAARQAVLDGLDDARVTTGGRGGGARTVVRIVFAVLLGVGTAALYWAISKVPARTTDELGDFLTVYPGMGLLVLAMLSITGLWSVPLLSRACVWLTPEGHSPLSSYLATRQVSSRLDHTRGLVMPVALSAAVVGVVLAWTDKLGEILRGAGAGESVRAPGDQLALLIGGAVVIALIASSSVSYASMDVRVRDAALLAAMGARPATLYRQAVTEALVYAAMAASLAYAAIAVNEWAMSTALAHGPAPAASLDALPWEPLVLIAVAFALNVANLLALTRYAASKDPVATLARSTT